jgi:4-hydroxy-tetrahydrodipicolinate synthase
MVDFSGIWIPLVTPFSGGALDRPALRRLVQRYAADGVAGFVVGGSTGEAAMLDAAELDASLATVIDAASGKPVICGLSGVQPRVTAARARELAQRHAIAAFLVSAPFYVKPSQAGIADYLTAVADASPAPVVAYDVPSRTGVRIETATLLALAGHPNIHALKDCSADRDAAEALLADGRLALLAGNDDELFDQLARGAAGGITASAHLRTAEFVALQRAIAAQRLDEAQRLWRRLHPLTRALFAEPSPAPIKAALAAEGLIANELRAPMTRASEGAIAAVDALINPR